MVSKLKRISDVRVAAKEKLDTANSDLVYEIDDVIRYMRAEINPNAVRLAVRDLTRDELEKDVWIGIRGDVNLNGLRKLVKWVEDMLADA